MNRDLIEGRREQWRGIATRHRRKILYDELAAIGGKYEELVERLQAKYGIAKAEAKPQVDDFKNIVEQLRRSMSS